MTAVKAINLVLPEIEVYSAGSSICGQLVLNLSSTLVDPVVKVELVGRGYLSWHQEGNPELDYEKTTAYTNKAVYVSKAKKFHIADSCLDSGIHTFDFHFSFPPEIPSTFTSKIGCISYFVQGICCSRSTVLAKEQRYVLLQGISGGHMEHAKDKAPVVVEARNDVVYFCCLIHGSLILQISLEKSIFLPGETIVFAADIDNRTCIYIRKIVFAVRCIVLYRGFSNRGDQYSLEDQNEVTRLECRPGTAPFHSTRVINALVLPKQLPVTSAPEQSNIMSFKYELVGTSKLPCATSTILGRVPIIITAIPEHLWSKAP
uniref:Arrestin domain containing 5 n=1 Tax=Pavo cristatus TaxID=9049 RepID=A0A8C9FCC5_PAVCR